MLSFFHFNPKMFVIPNNVRCSDQWQPVSLLVNSFNVNDNQAFESAFFNNYLKFKSIISPNIQEALI